MGELASDCTEAVFGLTCVIETVLGRRCDGHFIVYAGRRSSCPLQHRERGFDDRARGASVSDGFLGQRTWEASQPNLQHWYGLLPAMAVSGWVLAGGAGCLPSTHVQGRPTGRRASALCSRGVRFAAVHPAAKANYATHTGGWCPFDRCKLLACMPQMRIWVDGSHVE